MSAIEDAIRSAVEKGYKDYSETSGSYTKKYHSDILLDPSFWQALSKAKGWEKYIEGSVEQSGSRFYEKNWKRYWHEFIDHLIKGDDVESYFNSL